MKENSAHGDSHIHTVINIRVDKAMYKRILSRSVFFIVNVLDQVNRVPFQSGVVMECESVQEKSSKSLEIAMTGPIPQL